MVKKQDQILYIGFNKLKSLITVGTENGFHVFLSSTMEEVGAREMGGGLGIVEVLNTSNLMVFAGGGRYPLFPMCKVIIWDDDEERRKAEITFKSVVKALKIKLEYLFVILESKILVYNTVEDLELIYQAPTLMNLKGVFSVNNCDKTTVVAFPSELKSSKQHELGWICIVNIDRISRDNIGDEKMKIGEDYNFNETHSDQILMIKPHNAALTCLEFNFTGTQLATASEKGTLIRIWNTTNGKLIQELRRGHEHVILFCVTFDFGDNWLGCISDSGTVHIFNIDNKKLIENDIKKQETDNLTKNPKNILNWLSFISPYFKSEFSFSSYKIDFESKTKLTFLQDGSLLLQSYQGEVISQNFDKINGGACKRIYFRKNFMSRTENASISQK